MFIQVFTTTSSKKEAAKIAGSLIDKRLAACVQISKVSSVFMWKGKKQSYPEWLLIIKTRKPLYAKVESQIKKMHSYTLPEITSFDMKGSKDYLAWVAKETSK